MKAVLLITLVGAYLATIPSDATHFPPPVQAVRKVMVIAHRGASVEAPENTLAAFRLAIERRSDALEVDVRQTRDSQLVVLHDADLERTTGRKGKVGSFALEEIKQLDAGGWFHERFRGERIPTLDEVIGVLDSTTLLIVEVKEGSATYPGIEAQVVDLITRRGIQDRAILKSFDRSVIKQFARLAPGIPRLYVFVVSFPWIHLTIDHGISMGDIFDLNVRYLQPHRFLLTRSFIREAHRHGFEVIAWDVHERKTMSEMIEKGVDGIETDDPALLREILQNVKN